MLVLEPAVDGELAAQVGLCIAHLAQVAQVDDLEGNAAKRIGIDGLADFALRTLAE